MAKKWQSCITCQFFYDCPASKNRLEGQDLSKSAANDVGCFGFEQYKKATEPKQGKLF